MRKQIAIIAALSLPALLSGCASVDKTMHNLSPVSAQAQGGRPGLTVMVSDGTVAPKGSAPTSYQPIKMFVPMGLCNRATVFSNNKVKLSQVTACYKNNMLSLDPERFSFNMTRNAISFYPIPLWQSGYTYQNISSHGALHFQGATVSIIAKNGS